MCPAPCLVGQDGQEEERAQESCPWGPKNSTHPSLSLARGPQQNAALLLFSWLADGQSRPTGLSASKDRRDGQPRKASRKKRRGAGSGRILGGSDWERGVLDQARIKIPNCGKEGVN